MASIRKQIAAAIESALNGAGKPTGLNVHRMRTRSLKKDDLPAAIVYFDRAQTENRASQLIDRRETFVIELRVQGSQGTAPDDSIDPYYVWAVKALMADETLGGLAHRIDEVGFEVAAVEEDKIYVAGALEILVYYQTRRTDPEQAT